MTQQQARAALPSWASGRRRKPRALALAVMSILTVLAPSMLAPAANAAKVDDGDSRLRTIVTTDPELDDSNSLVRYLLCSGDFDTEGLIYASSEFHWKGDGQGTQVVAAQSRVRPVRPERHLPVHVVALGRGRAVHS